MGKYEGRLGYLAWVRQPVKKKGNLKFKPYANGRRAWLIHRLMHIEVFKVQWISSQEMDTMIQVQILDETVCISHNTN